MDLPKNKTKRLIENILAQAKYYLDEAGEFYPFGTVIDPADSIKPVSIYWGEEYPKSTEVLSELEVAVKRGIQENRYDSGAIGIDIYINSPSESNNVEKRSAIQIYIYSKDSKRSVCYLY